jgi:hypothetical protein
MVYIFLFVLYKQPPSNDKLPFSGIVLYTRLVFLLCACSVGTYCSKCLFSDIQYITPLLSKSKDIFALTLSLHKKEHDNSMSTVCSYCIYCIRRYCKTTKEEVESGTLRTVMTSHSSAHVFFPLTEQLSCFKSQKNRYCA